MRSARADRGTALWRQFGARTPTLKVYPHRQALRIRSMARSWSRLCAPENPFVLSLSKHDHAATFANLTTASAAARYDPDMLRRFALVAAEPSVERRPWAPSIWVLMGIAAVVLGIAIGAGISVGFQRGPLAKYEYHLWRWEADTLPGNAFARLGIGPNPGQADSTVALNSYFALTSQLRAAQDAEQPDLVLIEALLNERTTYENDVERIVERYIDGAVARAGLQERLPLFSGVRVTWPPVDFELTSPPRLLVRSPRSRIERAGDTLLKNDLTLRDIEAIEKDSDSANVVSLVVAVGGIAAYPAIVRDDRSYDSLLDTASHEWVHHYLAFYALGKQWGKGGDAETLNETTANIAGRELASLIRAAHPLKLPEGSDGRGPAGQAPSVDFNMEMRKLRLEVDALLKDGKVDEAERAMEERRKFLNEHGIAIRKLNQAYFAFFGTYGDSAASSNPVGPKVERVWQLTKDVGAFLVVMRDVKNVGDLDRAIGRLEGR